MTSSAVPLVDFGEDFDPTAPPPLPDSAIRSSGRSNAQLPIQSKLQRYLNALSLRPSHNPILDEPIDDVGADQVVNDDLDLGGGSFSLPGFDSSTTETKSTRSGHKNPEMDSFIYVESLMESLAMLGKLGYGLDAISQRVQIEMFNLVEATLEEVDERFVDFVLS